MLLPYLLINSLSRSRNPSLPLIKHYAHPIFVFEIKVGRLARAPSEK